MITSDKIRQLDQEREDISYTMDALRKDLRKNKRIQCKNKLGFTYKVKSDYDGSLRLDEEYGRTQENVKQKLAVALLSPDWSDNLPQIIEDITNQVNDNL